MKSIHLYSSILALLVFCSCKKFIEIKTPINEIQTAIVFSNDSTAQGAVTGLYTAMTNNNPFLMNAGTTIYTGLASDELKNNISADYDPFYTNTLAANNSSVYGRLWLTAYTNIYQVNAILEGLDRSTDVSTAMKNQLSGESKFVRALYYYYLVNLFGEVPLALSSDYRINAVLPRTPVNEVYEQIVRDLMDAKSLLPVSYPTAGRVRPNKYTAVALLARVYLHLGEWQKAEEAAGEVIGSSVYSLVSNLNNVFLLASNEAIWQLMPPSANSNTGEGALFVPFNATSVPTLSLSASLFTAFETGDQRKTNWVKSQVVNSVNYTFPFKYKVRSGATAEYYILFRLAEQYLIRAEARARLHNLPGSKADLNMIRSRAGLGNNTSADEASLLIAIERERRIELFAEWGHRWFDLKRTGRADAVLSIAKPGWNTEDQLFPIPQAELDKHPFLVQNPGY